MLNQKMKKFLLKIILENFLVKKRFGVHQALINTEEIFVGKVHNLLKKKYKNLITVIIPRHIDRDKSNKKCR